MKYWASVNIHVDIQDVKSPDIDGQMLTVNSWPSRVVDLNVVGAYTDGPHIFGQLLTVHQLSLMIKC